MMTSITPHRSGLPAYLALAYLLLIAYASLSPFVGWTEPAELAFLDTAWPRYYTRFDLTLNFLAYLPLGFLLGLAALGRFGPVAAALLAALAATALSFTMELAQAYLPGRISSNADLLANALGGFAGAVMAARMGRWPLFAVHLAQLRRDWFVSGNWADLGLALLGLWFFTQINPSIPLAGALEMAPVADPLLSWPREFSLMAALSVALNLTAVGLLLRRIARSAWLAMRVSAFLIAAASLIKLAAGWLLLKPEAALLWFSPEALVGIAYGGFLLIFTLPANARTVTGLCATALVAAIATAQFQPQAASAATALGLFNWRYGQLLNYTGLARFVAGLWPFLALAYLYLSPSPGNGAGRDQ